MKIQNKIKIMMTIAVISLVLVVPTITMSAALAKSESTASRFNQGFDDGCNDGKMAPGPHTKAYIDGFNEGLTRCDRNASGASASPGANPQCKAFCETRWEQQQHDSLFYFLTLFCKAKIALANVMEF